MWVGQRVCYSVTADSQWTQLMRTLQSDDGAQDSQGGTLPQCGHTRWPCVLLRPLGECQVTRTCCRSSQLSCAELLCAHSQQCSACTRLTGSPFTLICDASSFLGGLLTALLLCITNRCSHVPTRTMRCIHNTFLLVVPSLRASSASTALAAHTVAPFQPPSNERSTRRGSYAPPWVSPLPW